MLSKYHEIIQLFSVLTHVLPIFVCFLVFNKSSHEIRLFLFFLIFGFLIDIVMFGLVKSKNYGYLEPISSLYSLVESTFFFWLIWRYVEKKLKLFVKILYLLTLIYWIALIFLRFGFSSGEFIVSQYFDPVYEIMVSFFAGFILLQMVEKEDSVSDLPMFWIFIGIFFYCFCTFFIATFINSLLSERIWYLHNIFNIITLGFYTIGLWKYYKSQNVNAKKVGLGR